MARRDGTRDTTAVAAVTVREVFSRPRTRYAKSGGIDIAYQVFGDGPLDIVWTPGFVTHLDLAWELPVWPLRAERLSRFARVVLFDKRGTGLSERTAGVASVEERMDDIRAVMDATGLERAALVGYSEGGPMSILFAASHPERVQALVLGSTFAQPMDLPDLDERLAAVERHWGSGATLQFFVSSLNRDLAARCERSSATPRAAADILRANVKIDVRAALPAITVPTLVLHRRNDPVVPFEYGRAIADAISGARFAALDGDTHEAADVEGWEDEIGIVEEFLTGTRSARVPDRVLATVLFTDIVASTEHVAAAGDAAWRRVLETHRRESDRLIAEFRGRRVKDTGDGVLATFDGPTRAVRCAAAIVGAAARSGIQVRAGLHTGEVEMLHDGDIAGIAVHVASRVQSFASPNGVAVSQIVRDLTAGSGIELSEKGTHELKGVPGEWPLYELN